AADTTHTSQDATTIAAAATTPSTDATSTTGTTPTPAADTTHVAAATTPSTDTTGTTSATDTTSHVLGNSANAPGHAASTDHGSQPAAVETPPQITISAVGGSDEITATQQTTNASVSVNGSVSGTFEAGDVVTLNVGSSTFTGTVGSNGGFSIAVSADVLASATSVSASIAAHDASGNSFSASTSHSYVVDTVSTSSSQSTTLHVNDLLSTSSGDLLQNLPSAPATTTSTTTTTAPATDHSGGVGTVMIDAEALKALANSVTTHAASGGHHG
ncbi:MAG: hypothetical protein ACYDCF_09870, partial [Burkholderiales bacterium]